MWRARLARIVNAAAGGAKKKKSKGSAAHDPAGATAPHNSLGKGKGSSGIEHAGVDADADEPINPGGIESEEDVKTFMELRHSKVIGKMESEFSKLRGGRAHPGLLDHVRVDAYGQKNILSHVASVSVKDAQTLEVTPFDAALLSDIEKSIRESPLDLSPAKNESSVIIKVHPLDVEQLKSMRKLAGDMSESAKVAFRNARRRALEGIKAALLPQDDSRRLEKLVQKMVDQGCKDVDDKLTKKKQELS